MTNAELKTRFLIGYEFIANSLAPGYTDSEISGTANGEPNIQRVALIS